MRQLKLAELAATKRSSVRDQHLLSFGPRGSHAHEGCDVNTDSSTALAPEWVKFLRRKEAGQEAILFFVNSASICRRQPTLHPRTASKNPWTFAGSTQAGTSLRFAHLHTISNRTTAYSRAILFTAAVFAIVARIFSHYARPQHLRLGVARQFSDQSGTSRPSSVSFTVTSAPHASYRCGRRGTSAKGQAKRRCNSLHIWVVLRGFWPHQQFGQETIKQVRTVQSV